MLRCSLASRCVAVTVWGAELAQVDAVVLWTLLLHRRCCVRPGYSDYMWRLAPLRARWTSGCLHKFNATARGATATAWFEIVADTSVAMLLRSLRFSHTCLTFWHACCSVPPLHQSLSSYYIVIGKRIINSSYQTLLITWFDWAPANKFCSQVVVAQPVEHVVSIYRVCDNGRIDCGREKTLMMTHTRNV